VSVPGPRLTPEPASSAPGVAAAPRPLLGFRDAVGLIVGTIIGVGIFKTPALVGANISSEPALLMAWVAGGLVSLIGALCESRKF
jgi:basic amino acid/polyamine antiporter, APA family